MIQKHKKREQNVLVESQSQDLTGINRQELSQRINWVTKRQSLHQDMALRQHNHLKNITNIYSTNQRVKGLPHKQIDLFQDNFNKQDKENGNSFGRKHSGISSGGNSHKGSCQKKQKLTIISKRTSLRKISDFISYPSKEVKQQKSKQYSKTHCSNQQEICWGNMNKLQNELQQNFKNVNEPKKRKIRISVKRQVLKQLE